MVREWVSDGKFEPAEEATSKDEVAIEKFLQAQ